jgi:tetratricopeptide (TPR) repeat protein
MYVRARGCFAWFAGALILAYVLQLWFEATDAAKAIRLIEAGRAGDVKSLKTFSPDSTNAGALYILGLVAVQENDPATALKLANSARERAIQPSDNDLAMIASLEILALVQSGKAVEASEAADKCQPDQPATLALTKAMAYLAAGRLKDAESKINVAIANNGHSAVVIYNDVFNAPSVLYWTRTELLYSLKAIILYEQGRVEDALNCARDARRQNPDLALVHLVEGRAALGADDTERAQRRLDCFLECQQSEEQLWSDTAAKGIPVEEVLLPNLCIAIHRRSENRLLVLPPIVRQDIKQELKRVMGNRAEQIYVASAEKIRKQRHSVRDSYCTLQLLLGIALFAVGGMLYLVQRRILVESKRDVGWTEARVAEDQPYGDLATHHVIVAGGVMVMAAKLHLQLPFAITVLLFIYFCFAAVRYAGFSGKLAAIRSGFPIDAS